MLIVSSDIHDILFVFRPDAVENGDIECQGMTRAYLLRYRHMGGGVLQELDISICRPFPSKYDGYRNYHCDCSPHRAWVTIETIRNKVQRVLCRVSEKQGTVFCRGRATIPASEDCWKFICGSLPMGLQMFESIKISGLVRNGMVYQTYRKKRTNECFRFETCDLLALFKGLFSDVSVIGVRKPRPKIASPRECMSDNDHYNVIPTFDNVFTDVIHPKFSRRSTKYGIDMIYNGTEISVSIRYKRCRFIDDRVENDAGRNITNEPITITGTGGGTIDSDSEASAYSVADGDYFMDGDSDETTSALWQVTNLISNTTVEAKLIRQSNLESNAIVGTMEQFDFDFVALQVNKYYDEN
jgi:hypothetical protein